MIKLFRIDERLIHGQIAIKWSRHTGVDSIVVANDNAASNVMIQKSLKMAAPPGVKTVIKTIDDAVKTLNDPRCEPLKVLVLVNNPEDAVEMVTQVSGVPFVNIGNYGRVAPKKPGKRGYAWIIICIVTRKKLLHFVRCWKPGWSAFIRPLLKNRQFH